MTMLREALNALPLTLVVGGATTAIGVLAIWLEPVLRRGEQSDAERDGGVS